jgi:hypothetical protein
VPGMPCHLGRRRSAGSRRRNARLNSIARRARPDWRAPIHSKPGPGFLPE